MRHPDEGTLQALLDGELASRERDDVVLHVEACAPCAASVEALRADRVLLSEALRPLDANPRLEAARFAVRRRARSHGGWARRAAPLARAAAVVVALGGLVASALPGSPVREWFSASWNRLAGDPAAESAAAATALERAPATGAPGSETGVSVRTGPERMTVSIRGLPAGAEIRVELAQGAHTGVYAPEGTSFRTGPGVVEADAPAGPVRVVVPRDVLGADVRVDGWTYVRKAGSRLEAMVPGADVQGDTVVLRVRPRASGRPEGVR